MESTGSPHGVHEESMKHCLRCPHGVHKSMRTTWGLHMDSPWSPCALLEMLDVVLLKSMESPQSPHGLHKFLMDTMETHGESPWKSSWSLWEHVGECKVLSYGVARQFWMLSECLYTMLTALVLCV